jgi:protein AATF/BFR2
LLQPFPKQPRLPTLRDEAIEDHKAIEAAENAALMLWSTLEDLRHDLAKVHTPDTAKTGQKRKRPAPSTSSADIWSHMQSLESGFTPHRRQVLDKWSSKVRTSTAPDIRGKLMPKPEQHQNITALLDTQLITESDKLIQRTRIPRSGAPVQAQIPAKKAMEDSTVFDDTDFYQLLLRELVEQRMDSSSSSAQIALSIPIATSLRAIKVKKNVDTKASKGRKMRYTVHEKLQNFMAPEDRGTWSEKARDEFFGSLLGGKVDRALREDREESEEEREMEALRLFRT